MCRACACRLARRPCRGHTERLRRHAAATPDGASGGRPSQAYGRRSRIRLGVREGHGERRARGGRSVLVLGLQRRVRPARGSAHRSRRSPGSRGASRCRPASCERSSSPPPRRPRPRRSPPRRSPPGRILVEPPRELLVRRLLVPTRASSDDDHHQACTERSRCSPAGGAEHLVEGAPRVRSGNRVLHGDGSQAPASTGSNVRGGYGSTL